MKKILLVEDEELISESFSVVLSSTPYKLDVATNGQEALDFCLKNKYDLVLLDLMMPVMDGLEFLRQANLRETAPKTKVIILTNISGGYQIEEALELGGHKSKLKSDITPQTLLQIVKEELKQK